MNISRRGWFKLERGWRDNDLFCGEFSRGEAWLWLLENACWEPVSTNRGTLQRGQLSHSVRFMADKWQWSKSTVDRFLKSLRDAAFIEISGTDCGTNAGRRAGHSQSVITICNYDIHCAPSPEQWDSNGSDSGTAQTKTWDKEQDRRKLRTRIPPTPQQGSGGLVPFPDDWILPSKAELPPEAHACAEQWPDGAYEAEGEAFASYRRGRGDKQLDWQAAWAARVIDQHQHVMRGARAGIKYGGGDSRRGQISNQAPTKLVSPPPVPERDREDNQSAALRSALARLLSPHEAAWIESCALLIHDDTLRVIAETRHRAAYVEEQLIPKIEAGLKQAGLGPFIIRCEVSGQPARRTLACAPIPSTQPAATGGLAHG